MGTVMIVSTLTDPIACDSYDLAAYQTLSLGGRVHVVPPQEMPQGEIAALLRATNSCDRRPRLTFAQHPQLYSCSCSPF